jgi:hypothetical protein
VTWWPTVLAVTKGVVLQLQYRPSFAVEVEDPSYLCCCVPFPPPLAPEPLSTCSAYCLGVGKPDPGTVNKITVEDIPKTDDGTLLRPGVVYVCVCAWGSALLWALLWVLPPPAPLPCFVPELTLTAGLRTLCTCADADSWFEDLVHLW